MLHRILRKIKHPSTTIVAKGYSTLTFEKMSKKIKKKKVQDIILLIFRTL